MGAQFSNENDRMGMKMPDTEHDPPEDMCRRMYEVWDDNDPDTDGPWYASSELEEACAMMEPGSRLHVRNWYPKGEKDAGASFDDIQKMTPVDRVLFMVLGRVPVAKKGK